MWGYVTCELGDDAGGDTEGDDGGEEQDDERGDWRVGEEMWVSTAVVMLALLWEVTMERKVGVSTDATQETKRR